MWVAAADTGAVDAALVTAIWAFLGIVVTTLGAIAVQALRSRRESTSASAPTPAIGNGNGTALIQIARDQGVLHQRADDSDEAIDLIDRARARDREDLDDVLGFLDRHEPDWRSR